MSEPEPAASFVVRVTSGQHGPRIRLQDLRTGEVREFASWAEFLRYAETVGSRSTLR